MKAGLDIPASSENVTPLWLSEALGIEISEDNFHKEDNVQEGAGFLSSMARVHCKSADGSKEFHLIVKLLPQDEQMLAMMNSEKLDRTEIGFYRTLVPDLIAVCPELEGYLCKTYNGFIQDSNPSINRLRGSVLIMEDLKPEGYYSISFGQEESHEQIIEILEFMAKFHATGIALEKKRNKKLPLAYDFIKMLPDKSDSPMLYDMLKHGFENLTEFLPVHNVAEEVVEKYKSLAAFSDNLLVEMEEAAKLHPTLIHGDLWSNNMLFNNNPQRHTKVIDWQILGYKDPTYDVMSSIVCNISQAQLGMANIENYLEHYYKTFLAYCEKLGCLELVTRDWGQFATFAKSWGLAYALFWFVISGTEVFSANTPRFIKILEFLAQEAKVPEFLLGVFK